MAAMDEFKLPHDIVNVHGGAVRARPPDRRQRRAHRRHAARRAAQARQEEGRRGAVHRRRRSDGDGGRAGLICALSLPERAVRAQRGKMNVIVIGASRGIGREFVRQYLAARRRRHRHRAARRRLSPSSSRSAPTRSRSTSPIPPARRRLGWQHRRRGLRHRRRAAPASTARAPVGSSRRARPDFDTVMHTNVLGAMRVIPQLRRCAGARARSSRCCRRAWARSACERSTVRLALPRVEGRAELGAEGRLDRARRPRDLRRAPSRLGADRHGRAQADLTVERSVRRHARLLARLTARDNGRFLNHDGEALAW